MTARVLIIEDDPASLELVRYLLDKGGYEVLTARDGQEGLALMRRTRPEAVLCDLQMPVLGGFDVAAEIRREGLPVVLVAISASTMRRDQESAVAAGFDGFIAKPIDPGSFIAQIARFLGSRRHGSASDLAG